MDILRDALILSQIYLTTKLCIFKKVTMLWKTSHLLYICKKHTNTHITRNMPAICTYESLDIAKTH